MSSPATDLLRGVIVSEFDIRYGPKPILFQGRELNSEVIQLIADKTLNILFDENIDKPKLFSLDFPSISKKSLVRTFQWSSEYNARGNEAWGTLTLLYDETEDSIFYKYRSDIDPVVDGFIEIYIDMKHKAKSIDEFSTEFNKFCELLQRTLEDLAKHELIINESSEQFPSSAQITQHPTLIGKVIVIGDPSVGKTSTIIKYTQGAFKKSYIPTIGTNITEKKVVIDNHLVQLILWDIAGQQKFSSLRDKFYLGANGAILVFDLTNQKTFENISLWYEDLKNHIRNFNNLRLILCGNKSDLKDKIVVPQDQIEKIALKYNLKYFQTSALTGENIDLIFEILSKDLLALNNF